MHSSEQYGLDQLLRKLETQPQNIGWTDLVSSPKIPHSARERDLALQVGTTTTQANAADLFRGWQRPWLFWSAMKIGAALIAMCFAIVYGGLMLLNVTTQVSIKMLFLIPPMVVPIVLMVFFWELNVPRNITIWELFSFFLVGTLLSLGGTALMFTLVENSQGPYAALREEPSKLIAGAVLLIYFSKSKHKQIYGLTGLVIGAAVGSGFSAFETISYGLAYDLSTVMIRVFFAVVGHTMYSCTYVAALALHSPGGELTTESFCNFDFICTFLCSVICHAFWNTESIPVGIRFAVNLVVLWYMALWITRKCFVQVADRRRTGTRPHSEIAASPAGKSKLVVRCLRGGIAGSQWVIQEGTLAGVGRGTNNQIQIPSGIQGISRVHCYLERQPSGWAVMDAHSSYGTFLQQPGGKIYKLTPGKQYNITSGSLIFLGSQKFCISVTVL